MNQLEYIPGIGGQKSIPMDGPSAFVGTADGLRSRKWQYDLGYRGLLNVNRPAREVDVDFVSDYETADTLRRVADADVAARTPGVFVAQNEWRQNAYIVESEPTNIHYGWLSTTLKALLLDGAWWRIVKKPFRPENTVIDKQYITKTDNVVYATGASDAPLNSLKIYGKSKQTTKPKDGASVPVEVVEPLNILDPANIIRCYISTSSTTIKATGTSVYAEVQEGETYTFTRNGGDRFYRGFTTDIPATGVSVSNVTKCGNGTTDLTVTFTAPSGVNYVILYVDNSSTFTPDEYQLERGSDSSPYVPYGCIGLDVGGSITPIDLDGNVIASLPDGTQDILTVNSTGAVTLTKRVGVVDLNTLTWGPTGQSQIYFRSNPQSTVKRQTGVPGLLAEKFAAASIGDVWSQTGKSTYIIGETLSANYVQFAAKTDGANNPFVYPTGLCYYPLAEEQEITLDSIDMPMVSNYAAISIAATFTPVITAKYETSPSVFLDYPHDYEYDYLARSAAASVETSVLTDCDVRLVIYGQCDNPYVVIGGNRYQVNCGVPAGAYLTIDGREKTIILTLEDGTTVNVFGDGVRGSGLGSGEYVFEPIQPGAQNVEWDGSFGFDLGWYEEEGEPPWSQS